VSGDAVDEFIFCHFRRVINTVGWQQLFITFPKTTNLSQKFRNSLLVLKLNHPVKDDFSLTTCNQLIPDELVVFFQASGCCHYIRINKSLFQMDSWPIFIVIPFADVH
jgi:hypothetical protein